eukprot:scaffold1612_cov136-Skeletonema_marinoi.AAC.11
MPSKDQAAAATTTTRWWQEARRMRLVATNTPPPMQGAAHAFMKEGAMTTKVAKNYSLPCFLMTNQQRARDSLLYPHHSAVMTHQAR